MHEENGKAVKKVKPDAGMGDGWTRIQVRYLMFYLKMKNAMICFKSNNFLSNLTFQVIKKYGKIFEITCVKMGHCS